MLRLWPAHAAQRHPPTKQRHPNLFSHHCDSYSHNVALRTEQITMNDLFSVRCEIYSHNVALTTEQITMRVWAAAQSSSTVANVPTWLKPILA